MGCLKLTYLPADRYGQSSLAIVKPAKEFLFHFHSVIEIAALSSEEISDTGVLYRYGLQDQEKDDEIKGKGNSVNYKYRMHDPRLGRFFAVDPLTAKYPHYSPYMFSGNKVIHSVELEGLEENEINETTEGNNSIKVDNSEDSEKPKEYKSLWRLSIGLNISSPKQKQQSTEAGPSHPTLIHSFNPSQGYYTTDIYRPFLFGENGNGDKNDITEGNYIIHLEKFSDNGIFLSKGLLVYKEKPKEQPNGFIFEAMTSIQFTGTIKTFSKDYFKGNLGITGSITEGVGVASATTQIRTQTIPNFKSEITYGGFMSKNQRPVGASASFMFRVDMQIVKRLSVYVAGSYTHITTARIRTNYGDETSKSFNTLGVKVGMSVSLGGGLKR